MREQDEEPGNSTPATQGSPVTQGLNSEQLSYSEVVRNENASTRNMLNDVLTRSISSQQSPIPRENPRPFRSRDGQTVTFRPSPEIKSLCPSGIRDRHLWLENFELMLNTNTSGIQWYSCDQLISCRLENEDSNSPPQGRIFNVIDHVVPFDLVFTSTKETCKGFYT